MTWGARKRAYAVLFGAATLLGGGWAQAKGPSCEIRIDAVDFTRPSYPAGRWFSGRVVGAVYDDGQVVEPGARFWDGCLRYWDDHQLELIAVEATTGQRVAVDVFSDLGDVILAGQIDPLHAGGRYVIEPENRVDGVHFVDEVAFEVEANPDADLEPPELVGFRVAQNTRAGRMPPSDWRFADRSPLRYHGSVRYRRLGGEGAEHDSLACAGRVCDSGFNGFGLSAGSYVIERLVVEDALGNESVIEAHSLFDGVVIRVGSGEPGSVVRGNLTGTPLPDGVLPPPVALDRVVTAPRLASASPAAPTERFVLDRADTPSSHPDCRAAPSGAGHGAWALLLLLAAFRRRNRR